MGENINGSLGNWRYMGSQRCVEGICGLQHSSHGYNEEDKPTFHQRMRQVKVGDLIFIKSKFIQNGQLDVKAIGIVTNEELCAANGYAGQDGIKVCWIKNLTDNPVRIRSPNEKDSITTFYQEKDPSVVKEIVHLL